MRKVFLVIGLFYISFAATAQLDDEPAKGGFKKENIFVGGGIGLGLGGWSGGFNIGANPEVGYSITNWIDAGISTNINYYSFRAESNYGVRQRTINYGVGTFVRLYPIHNFFVQALPEYNWIRHNLRDYNYGGLDQKIKAEAPSFLLGVGYGTRTIGQGSFFTVLMFDVGNNINSPYIDSYNAKLPILRTGFNIYLRSRRR